ncbi:MAG: SEC-C domain-containing protein [Flavobacteriales bacterium]|nr:MAG: SEC-C domain-containing protein [Flavobacteriales bacterium]
MLVAHRKYPGLGLPYTLGGIVKLHAELVIRDVLGERWGAFVVTIEFPLAYPQIPPRLYEDQGRIKRTPDWHVNGDDSLCIGPEVSELEKYDGAAHLQDWLDRSAIPFLANHLHKERTAEYKNGEFQHYTEGIWEYYAGEWNCSRAEVLRRLSLITGEVTVPRNELCYCGSDLPWAKCHGPRILKSTVLRRAYAADLNRLRKS